MHNLAYKMAEYGHITVNFSYAILHKFSLLLCNERFVTSPLHQRNPPNHPAKTQKLPTLREWLRKRIRGKPEEGRRAAVLNCYSVKPAFSYANSHNFGSSEVHTHGAPLLRCSLMKKWQTQGTEFFLWLSQAKDAKPDRFRNAMAFGVPDCLDRVGYPLFSSYEIVATAAYHSVSIFGSRTFYSLFWAIWHRYPSPPPPGHTAKPHHCPCISTSMHTDWHNAYCKTAYHSHGKILQTPIGRIEM